MCPRVLIVFGFALGVMALARVTDAQTRSTQALPSQQGPAEVQLQFSGVAGCPAAAVFRARFSQLTTRVSLTDSLQSQRLNVRLWRVGDRFLGRISAPDVSLDRQLTASVCADLTQALALVAAVAFDPDAKLPPGVVDTPEASAADSTAGVPAAGAPAASAPEARAAAAGAAAPGTAAPGTTGADAVPTDARGADAAAKPTPSKPQADVREPTHAQVRELPAPSDSRSPTSEEFTQPSAGAPRFALGIGPLLRVEGESGLGLGGQLELSAAGRDAWRRGSFGILAARGRRDLALGEVRSTLLAADLAWCPQLVEASHFGIALCVGAEGGALVTQAVPNPRLAATNAKWRPHLAGFAGATGAWQFASRWALQVRARAIGLIKRDTLAIDNVQGQRETALGPKPFGGEGAVLLQYDL